mmetsp:Transcript_2660/g.8018  ORF Transcript_2660/g.8018 Transcript_2660/m.8018 type:complete len:273 (+) Transcript_2660:148-966(+)
MVVFAPQDGMSVSDVTLEEESSLKMVAKERPRNRQQRYESWEDAPSFETVSKEWVHSNVVQEELDAARNELERLRQMKAKRERMLSDKKHVIFDEENVRHHSTVGIVTYEDRDVSVSRATNERSTGPTKGFGPRFFSFQMTDADRGAGRNCDSNNVRASRFTPSRPATSMPILPGRAFGSQTKHSRKKGNLFSRIFAGLKLGKLREPSTRSSRSTSSMCTGGKRNSSVLKSDGPFFRDSTSSYHHEVPFLKPRPNTLEEDLDRYGYPGRDSD